MHVLTFVTSFSSYPILLYVLQWGGAFSAMLLLSVKAVMTLPARKNAVRANTPFRPPGQNKDIRVPWVPVPCPA